MNAKFDNFIADYGAVPGDVALNPPKWNSWKFGNDPDGTVRGRMLSMRVASGQFAGPYLVWTEEKSLQLRQIGGPGTELQQLVEWWSASD